MAPSALQKFLHTKYLNFVSDYIQMVYQEVRRSGPGTDPLLWPLEVREGYMVDHLGEPVIGVRMAMFPLESGSPVRCLSKTNQ